MGLGTSRTLRRNDVNDYPALLRKLSAEEGDGWLVEYIDLPGCMGAGESISSRVVVRRSRAWSAA